MACLTKKKQFPYFCLPVLIQIARRGASDTRALWMRSIFINCIPYCHRWGASIQQICHSRCNAFRSHFLIHLHGKVEYSNFLLFYYSLYWVCKPALVMSPPKHALHTPSIRCRNIFKFIEIYALISAANIDFQSEANVERTTTKNNNNSSRSSSNGIFITKTLQYLQFLQHSSFAFNRSILLNLLSYRGATSAKIERRINCTKQNKIKDENLFVSLVCLPSAWNENVCRWWIFDNSQCVVLLPMVFLCNLYSKV